MISTHILDTSLGQPAAHVQVRLFQKNGPIWSELAHGQTNTDGRFTFDCITPPGDYKIIFEIENYFKSSSQTGFFLDTSIVFRTESSDKHHVPLLLSPYGYSTYRGS